MSPHSGTASRKGAIILTALHSKHLRVVPLRPGSQDALNPLVGTDSFSVAENHNSKCHVSKPFAHLDMRCLYNHPARNLQVREQVIATSAKNSHASFWILDWLHKVVVSPDTRCPSLGNQRRIKDHGAAPCRV